MNPRDSNNGVTPFLATRSKIIKAVYSPLGFCALALLIVEAFLWGAGAFFNLPDFYKIIAIFAGILLFVLVFVTVIWLVVKHPQNLVFSEESHVQYAAMHAYGTEARQLSAQDAKNIPVAISNPASSTETQQVTYEQSNAGDS